MLARGDTKKKIANAIIFFAQNATTSGKPLGMTKLMKLLFYFDCEFYTQTGFSSTGLDYYAWQQGPVPKDVWHNLHGDNDLLNLKKSVRVLQVRDDDLQMAITPTQKFDGTEFTDLELELLEQISFMYQELTATQISTLSHEKDKPWDVTRNTKGDKTLIDYNLSLPKSLTEEDLEEFRERQQDYEFFSSAFGGM